MGTQVRVVFTSSFERFCDRIRVAKDDAPVRANVRGIRHSITTKQLEQQL